MSMYEARQNKEKTSRTLLYKKEKIGFKHNITSILQCACIEGNKAKPIQRVKTIAIEMLPFIETHVSHDADYVNIRKHYTSLNLGRDYYNYAYANITPIPPVGLVFAPVHKPKSNSFGHVNTIGIHEKLILVSHGFRYIPIFAFRTPSMLARKVFNSNILPFGYDGQIYLDGCHTGEPGFLGTLRDGSSFAEKFKNELLRLSNRGVNMYGNFTVKGNLGTANTSFWGTEWIEGDRRTSRLLAENQTYMGTHGIPFWTSDNHEHSRPTTIRKLFGLIREPGFDYRGKFTKVEF